MDIRKELHVKLYGNKFFKPPACYTLQTNPLWELFCTSLKHVRLPESYATILSKNVSLTKKEISGLEAYDCHVILQRILPIASQRLQEIASTFTEPSNFFQQLCVQTLHVKDLKKLQERIAFILCKFEKIYPPSFFDIMVHLAVHLPHEARLVGPVGFWWMFPFESVDSKAYPTTETHHFTVGRLRENV